jgi:hypothetical protein
MASDAQRTTGDDMQPGEGGEGTQPGEGRDSRVEDWFGQSVERDAELADQLTEEVGAERAEELFDERSHGREEQDARHGDRIDPDQGRGAYQRDA